METVLSWAMQKLISLTLPFFPLPRFWLQDKAVGGLDWAAVCDIRDPKAREKLWCCRDVRCCSCCQRGLLIWTVGFRDFERCRSSCLRYTGHLWKYGFGGVCTLYPGIRESTPGFGVREWKAKEESCFGKIQRGTQRGQENVIFG